MRLSANEADRSYCALLMRPGYDDIRVTLDGVEVKGAQTADEETGEVIRAALNESGEKYLIDDKVAIETLYGKVVIITPPGFPRNRLYWIVPRWRELIRRWYRRHVPVAWLNW